MVTKVVPKVKYFDEENYLRPNFDNFAPDKSLTQKNNFCINILVLISQKLGCGHDPKIGVSKVANIPHPDEHFNSKIMEVG